MGCDGLLLVMVLMVKWGGEGPAERRSEVNAEVKVRTPLSPANLEARRTKGRRLEVRIQVVEEEASCMESATAVVPPSEEKSSNVMPSHSPA